MGMQDHQNGPDLINMELYKSFRKQSPIIVKKIKTEAQAASKVTVWNRVWGGEGGYGAGLGRSE